LEFRRVLFRSPNVQASDIYGIRGLWSASSVAEIRDSGRYPPWPKVADAVIEAKSHSCKRSTAPAPSGCGEASLWSCRDWPGCPCGFSWIGIRPDRTQRKEDSMPYYMYVALQEDDKIAVFTIDPHTGT